MTSTIVCEYCRAKNLLTHSHCQSCNAILPETTIDQPKARRKDFPAKVMKLCERYEETDWCFTSETAETKKLVRATKTFGIPADEDILMLYDDTLFGSNKNGFAVCLEGIYWRNAWDTPTKRTSLTWEKFAEREIKLGENSIDFGRGDRISIAVTPKEDQKQILAFFKKLQALVTA